ncbi:MAG: Primosomal protein 1 [Pseudomonadota bacterium]
MLYTLLPANDDLFVDKSLKSACAFDGPPDQTAMSFESWGQTSLQILTEQLLVLELARVSRDEIKHNSYLMTKTRLQGYIHDYFSSQALHAIDAQVMEGFVQFLTDRGLSSPTIKGYLAVCLKLLRFLHRKHILPQMPLLPPVKAQHKPRGAFTLTEYKAIVRRARELQGQHYTTWGPGKRIWIKDMYQTMPAAMNGLIRFMVYTFIRPGDLRQLKHKHVEIVRGKFTYLRLTLPEVKRHAAPMISLPPAVHLFQKIQADNARLGRGGPEDHVFFPLEEDRKLALGIAGWLFNWILYDLDLKSGPHGADRSLYSLRHTAITFRLLYGGKIDLLTLAKNARTSVEMIERFYASTLAAEANVSLLHSRRSRAL